MKLSITLKAVDACELIREGLAKRGMLIEGDLETTVLFKPDEITGSFVVEVSDVTLSPPPPTPRAVRELPSEVEAVTTPKRLKLKKTAEPASEDDDASFASVMGENARLLRNAEKAKTTAKPNPARDAQVLGGTAHRRLEDFGIDPAEISDDEINPGQKGG